MPSVQEAPTKKRKRSRRRKRASARKRASGPRTRKGATVTSATAEQAAKAGTEVAAVTPAKRTATRKRRARKSTAKTSNQVTRKKPKTPPATGATRPDGTTPEPAIPTGAEAVPERPQLDQAPGPTDPALILEASLRRALNTLWFAYQPIVDAGFQIVGYEALLRSQEPGLDTALPLLESARRQGLSDDLLLQMWTQAPGPFGPGGLEDTWLFMNVEPGELVLFRDLARSGPLRHLAHRIVLEITERASLRDRVGMADASRDLRSMGFRIAVDDFGGAFSGIDTFAAVEPALIKLDGGLIRGVDRSAHRRLYVRKVLEMCQELGVEVVAEQVETPAEFDCLRDLGCHYLQGFFAGRPEPLGRIAK